MVLSEPLTSAQAQAATAAVAAHVPQPRMPVQHYTVSELEAAADGVASLADARTLLRRFARGLGGRIEK
jgi:hypothetical protein